MNLSLFRKLFSIILVTLVMGCGAGQSTSAGYPDGMDAGESISMNTRDVRYAPYMAHIKRKIYSAWHWPEEGKGYTGKLRLKFVIRKNGTLAGWKLLDSSGYKVLDDGVIAAVTEAAPFNRFPPNFKKKVLAVDGLFVYERPW